MEWMLNNSGCSRKLHQVIGLCLMLVLTILASSPHAESNRISISLEDVEIQKVMRMLSKQQRLNIFVSEGVDGKVSINLYDMEVVDAIRVDQRCGRLCS